MIQGWWRHLEVTMLAGWEESQTTSDAVMQVASHHRVLLLLGLSGSSFFSLSFLVFLFPHSFFLPLLILKHCGQIICVCPASPLVMSLQCVIENVWWAAAHGQTASCGVEVSCSSRSDWCLPASRSAEHVCICVSVCENTLNPEPQIQKIIRRLRKKVRDIQLTLRNVFSKCFAGSRRTENMVLRVLEEWWCVQMLFVFLFVFERESANVLATLNMREKKYFVSDHV